ncbi:Adenylate cyclase [Mycena venus]|uniref:Adenylate cyclase n=1 Tax=Mycena venus TaxID=2733690 RepID=A0A8H7CW34_9AGAR|nr:Adenylate cyclase [Mycena venus]
MYMASTSKRGSRDGSPSPPPERKLRKSKSSEFLHSVRRKVSLKSIRLGFGRPSTDESEHPSLREPNPNTSNPAFQPISSLSKRRFPLIGRPPKRSIDVPPVPQRPVDPEDHPIDININIDDEEEMKGIVNRERQYGDGNDTSSPSSTNYTSPPTSYSGHSQFEFRNPWMPAPPIRSPDPVGPTDISDRHGPNTHYRIPDSWAVTPAVKPRRDPDEESTSDDGRPSNATALPRRWKMRIYGPDNNEYILRVSADDTLDAKLPPGEDREAHELYLKERGRERILKPKEKPAYILQRCLQQAGYDESDGDGGVSRGGVGMPGVPFILKFVYRSLFLGSADEDLSFNNFVYINLTGRSLVTIPVVLHQHADTIVSLRLSRNPMIDIPHDFIQSCIALSELYLSHMSLKKVPYSIRHSATLTLLDLSSNRIASLEDAGLDEIPRLTTLDIQNNRLERLPRAFPRHLLNLNISNNKFNVFPLAVTQLTRLSRLDISFNSISELPREIGRLTCLTKLVIVGNQISALPEEFGSLALLQELDCRRNGIADLAVACGLPELMFLSADHNNSHTLVLSLGPRLKGLDVSHNDITELVLGPHVSTTPPFALTCLDISNAKLSVLDDYTLAQLLSLRHLKLNRNSFRTLPESLGDLMWLETLSCADNALSELPDSVGRLQKLESLDLHNNSLTALPMSLWNCASLSRLNVTSNLLVVWHDPPPSDPDGDYDPPSFPAGKFAPQSDVCAFSAAIHFAENSLTDEMLHPLMILKELRVLNLSFNDIQELPCNFFRDLTQLEEVFLSGNRLTHIPSEDLPRLERLSTLFLNGNHLQHLPHELGKVKSLTLLDVGNNQLKYNINNLDYDWNWNFNKNLVYLNLSGNEQLQIKSDVHGRPTHLRVLGLMDVTITNTGTNSGSDIPDESDDRRVRTSSSLVNGLSYGIADTLGKNRHPHMMDLVHEFRGLKKDTVFAMFGRSHPANQAVATTANGLAKYLKDNFIRVFISQLNSLDRQRAEGVPDALRRSFLKLNQDYHDSLFGSVRKMSLAGGPTATEAALLNNGASGIVVYIVDKRMYVANVGNILAIVSRGGTAHPVSRKHEPYDRAEIARIRAAEGWISPPGLVGDELDISRSFGFYHLLPMVNARPDICEYELTSMDDMIIIANRGLWDYVEYQTAVDLVQRTEPMAAAQKLRDLAISYGAEGSTMIMVVSLASLFQEKVGATPADRRRRPRIGVVDRTLDRLKDEVPPPVGHVAIVFTDIKGSTHLWEATPSGMITAIHLHNNLLRRHLRLCGGYEVRTEGDSFMCTFPTVLAAVWWCLTIQVQLLKVSWPQDILECPDGKEVYDVEGRLIYRGLSVRIGIHCGSPLCLTDPVTTRMDYFGLMVTRAARIASVATGGQVMFSADVLNEINARVFGTEPDTEYSDSQPKEAIHNIRQLDPVVVTVGEVKLKGLEAPETLSFVLPAILLGRKSHNETVVVNNPANPLILLPPPPSGHFDIAQIRELARLCVRLEMASADPILSSLPDKPSDFDVLLPPNAAMTDAELSTILYSLTLRVENAEAMLRGRSRLPTKNDLVSTLLALDERTLEEVWTMLHRR